MRRASHRLGRWGRRAGRLVVKSRQRRRPVRDAALEQLRRTHELAHERYRGDPYPGAIDLIHAGKLTPRGRERRSGWHTLAAGGLRLHPVPGIHRTMLREPQVGRVAEVLSQCLLAAAKQAS